MNNANAAMNARTPAASDWVDYALDQQTVVGQGGLVKVSNSYSHTWSSTVGNQTQWFQINDPNANPNGTLSGNWTEDTSHDRNRRWRLRFCVGVGRAAAVGTTGNNAPGCGACSSSPD